ncbi:MAG: hypothetical protein JSV89_11285 [Spirochaetaceae bacterium]|nr:MAG: hypothetical protein JSV89_11285 [Spirochaetaceae bacterium]
MSERRHDSLISYRRFGQSAQLSVPTRDHYLPMLYTLALQQTEEQASIQFEGIQHASVSMLCFGVGI